MTNRALSAILFLAAASLAGCSSTETQQPSSSALRSGSAVDETACERAVATATNNGDTVVLSSEFSQANTEVIVGVGNERAKWRCLVSNGRVAEVMSLTDEGAL